MTTYLISIVLRYYSMHDYERLLKNDEICPRTPSDLTTCATFERWVAEGAVKADRRLVALRPAPPNKLSEEERTDVLKRVNAPRFADFPPTQIVPILADEGTYLASESTVYQILREAD